VRLCLNNSNKRKEGKKEEREGGRERGRKERKKKGKEGGREEGRKYGKGKKESQVL
jgi:flagellar biosynthesis/type III secretory pathway protein FliH